MTRRSLAPALLACAVLAGCAVPVAGAAAPLPATPPVATSAPTSAPASAAPTSAPPACPDPAWSCEQQQRFTAVESYTRREVGAHGYLGVVFTDRRTGAVWRSGATDHEGWTASTIKLAIATDLLQRERAGTIALAASDRHDMDTMLNFSDEAASDRLWKKYGGDAMLARFRSDLGMTGLHFVPGFTKATYWGFVKCTTDDLAALMGHVLTRTDPADRTYLVDALRGVASNQQWGVWGAGPTEQPGNKDGWSFESDSYGKHWVTDTVGFAGPAERYAVAIMYQVDPSGSLADGAHTVSDVAALLFGRPTPAPITVPAPDG
ncbi:tat pathway signal sequence [Pseudonocardia sp.]|jgi:hypothetical protein|uniref:tat pathway signal sequence n=1 Tax=Pseudonocardia sp. TaxID=60912 RepID=UPI002637C436|nr:tat pathway signal sequence [Pseudonocardia sp.]MCW2721848.1 hypothetical protein [Pseudonocardia sp.]MDT7617108.1 hypothetical protein [Pseudonocardiales bacterium]